MQKNETPNVLAELAEKKLNALSDIGNSEEFLIINFSLILQSQIKKTKPNLKYKLCFQMQSFHKAVGQDRTG